GASWQVPACSWRASVRQRPAVRGHSGELWPKFVTTEDEKHLSRPTPELAIFLDGPVEANPIRSVVQSHFIEIVHLRVAGLNAPQGAAPFCCGPSDSRFRWFSPVASVPLPCEWKTDSGSRSLFPCARWCG